MAAEKKLADAHAKVLNSIARIGNNAAQETPASRGNNADQETPGTAWEPQSYQEVL